MAAFTNAPSTHKQTSRKGKRAWRKNVDLTSIESGLDTIRDEALITGGKPLSEVDASTLFHTDTVGDEAAGRAYRKKHKPLKADEILAQRSAVPALSTHKRPASNTAEGLRQAGPKRRKGGISNKELARLKEIAFGGGIPGQRELVATDDAPTHDPWAVDALENTLVDSDELAQTFIEKPLPAREPRTLKHPPISLSANGKPIPSVPKPHAGRSYNPAFDAWSALLKREGDKAVEAERRRLKAQAAEEARVERAAEIAAMVEQEEDRAGNASDFESEWEGVNSETESAAQLAATKRPQRKTPAERNRIKRRKAAEALAKQQAHLKKLRQEEARQLTAASQRQLKQEMALHEAALAKTLDEHNSSDDDSDGSIELRANPLYPSRVLFDNGDTFHSLGKRSALPSGPLELVLPDELQSSLRQLKPEGNLLADRFRTAVLQGRVEGRLRPLPLQKQARRKTTEKWSHKDWKLVRSSVAA